VIGKSFAGKRKRSLRSTFHPQCKPSQSDSKPMRALTGNAKDLLQREARSPQRPLFE
jgi:hypothetical protein